MQNLDISQFSERSAVNVLDRLLLVTTEGNDGSIKVSLIMTQLRSEVTPSIDSSGMWLVGEVETGIQAIGKTPQLKQDPLGIVWKYDTDTEWRLLVPWSSIKFTFDELTEAQKDELTPTLEDFSPEEIAELQKPAAEMVAILRATDDAVKAAETIRVESENQRVDAETARETAESVRVESENARLSAELLRGKSEKERSDAEVLRVQNENVRIESETGRTESETERKKNEESRKNDESIRTKNEAERVSAESDRRTAETARANAESERKSSESSRKSAETSRSNNERSRNDAESARKNAEESRVGSEKDRVAAEQSRAEAESARVSNESARMDSESERESSETARLNAESLRVANETGRVRSEQERIANENIRKSNEEERGSSETVRKSNEQGRVSAESDRVIADNERKDDYAVLREDIVSATKEAWAASAEVRNIPIIKDGTWWVWDVDNDMYKDSGSPATGRSPKIENGTWWVWDDINANYIDTGQSVSADYQLTKEGIESVLTGNIGSHHHSRYVDKIEGKSLSTEDFTTAEKARLAALENYDDTGIVERLDTLEGWKNETDVQLQSVDVKFGKVDASIESVDERMKSFDDSLSSGLATKQDANLYFSNVSATNWVLEGFFKDFKYRCDISLEGVEEWMLPEVIFGMEESSSGDYAPICSAGDGFITIWSAKDVGITIPTVVIYK